MSNICKCQRSNYIPSIFDNVFNEMLWSESSIARSPKYDVIENDNEFIVNLHLAGIKKEDISIDINKEVLTIKAERKVSDVKYNHKESYSGLYQISFSLPDNVNQNNIGASYVDGVLEIIVSKVTDVKLGVKKIEIM